MGDVDEQDIQLVDEVRDLEDRPQMIERAKIRESTTVASGSNMMSMLGWGVRNMDYDEAVNPPRDDGLEIEDKPDNRNSLFKRFSSMILGNGSFKGASFEEEMEDPLGLKAGAGNYLSGFDRKEFRAVFATVSKGAGILTFIVYLLMFR